MNRKIYPPLDAHASLRQPLEAGERTVLDFFCRKLAPEWEIYIQPHLNGLRPDFVIINPQSGIAVFEVKDWNLEAIDYYIKYNKAGHPGLYGSRDGKTFSLERQNPFTKISVYREEIFKLYCPRLQHNFGFAAITGGVIFPFADSLRIRELQRPFLRVQEEKYKCYLPVSGRDSLASDRLESVFPEGIRKDSKLMSEDLAADLRGWLREPDFSATQRQRLQLDPTQRRLAETSTASGYRRIRAYPVNADTH